MKKIVKPLLAGAGVTGAIAATNRALSNAPLPTNVLGGTRRPWTWRGYEIFATEAGSGPLVLLVHGMGPGASSYEYRALFALLAARHRVIAFDLLGCGLSDKPNLRYTEELFVEQIVDALDAFGREPATIVASSAGAAFAMRAAVRAHERIARLVAICPSGLAAPPGRGSRAARSAIYALLRAPVLGEAFANALAAKASIRRLLQRRAYADPGEATPEVVDHLYAVAHQPGARYVLAALAGGSLDCDVARDLPFLEIPLAILWGERAPADNPRSQADEFRRLARDARVFTFARSALLPHEEEAAAVADAVEAFLAPRETTA